MGEKTQAQESGRWAYAKGACSIEIDGAKTGQIVKWVVDGKAVVDAASPVSPLSLNLDGKVAAFVATSFREIPVAGGKKLVVSGNLGAIPVALSYEIAEGGGEIRVGIDAREPGIPAEVKEYGWSLPLALSPRKRVWYLGDYGFEWETRYFYQITVDSITMGKPEWEILSEPDRNEWRFFALDQLAPGAFRLWKAESAQTAPLTTQEGRIAAPVVQVYDEKGGVTVEYPALRQAAPKSLRVDAAGGGAVEVAFQPRNAPAGPSSRPGLFGRQDIVLTAQASEKGVLAVRAGIVEREKDSFTTRPNPESALQEPGWVSGTPPTVADVLQYATGGYPFAAGELRDAAAIRVSAAGVEAPVQAKPLAYWPDGSVKWALLTFPFPATRAARDMPPASRVSLRSGGSVPVTVSVASDGGASPAASVSLSARQEKDGSVSVANGDLRVSLGTGKNWLRTIEWKGTPILASSAQGGTTARAYCDYLVDSTDFFPGDRRPKGGHRDAGVLSVDSVVVEDAGPLRCRVRLEGLTSNAEPTRIVLRFEFLAGRPEIAVTHTAVFRFADPRSTFLTAMGLDFPLAPGWSERAEAAGKSFSEADGRVAVFQESNERQTLLPAGDAGTSLHGILRVGGKGGDITAVLRNFAEQAPDAVSADLKGKLLRFELWPEDAPAMDVRRYSDYLHRGKTESGFQESDGAWFRDKYYASKPFYGVSRTHEMRLSFHSGQNTEASLDAAGADFQSPPLLYAGWERYRDTGVVEPSSSPEAWPRAWEAWSRLAQFFLYHRELHDWHGFWNFGDFQSRFRGGFGWILPPEPLKDRLAGKERPDLMATRKLDNTPPNDWNFDCGAWGWMNTEGRPNLFLQHEYLRHGNRAVYFAAEAMALHARDVVMRQEGPWFGKGTRHGVQPWSDGNHEERQTDPDEYGLHYLLSGDGRSRDLIEALYRQTYLKGKVDYAASHSGRLAGLLFHWELTGSPEEGERLARYVRLFLSPDGIYTVPSVKFPEVAAAGNPQKLNDGDKFFHTFGAMDALLKYQRLTGDKDVADAVIKMADAIIRKPIIEKKALGESDFSWGPVAFAAAHAADPKPYRDFLRRYLEVGGWRNAYQPVTRDRSHWSGPTGIFVGSPTPLAFFWANWAPYVTAALPEGEIWTPEIEAAFNENEAQGSAWKGIIPSWQSNFDGIPELQNYLGSQQPWNAK